MRRRLPNSNRSVKAVSSFSWVHASTPGAAAQEPGKLVPIGNSGNLFHLPSISPTPGSPSPTVRFITTCIVISLYWLESTPKSIIQPFLALFQPLRTPTRSPAPWWQGLPKASTGQPLAIASIPAVTRLVVSRLPRPRNTFATPNPHLRVFLPRLDRVTLLRSDNRHHVERLLSVLQGASAHHQGDPVWPLLAGGGEADERGPCGIPRDDGLCP